MTSAAWLTLLQGTATTLSLSLAGVVLGIAAGLAIALLRIERWPVITQVIVLYVSLIRATPLITLCLVVALGLPAMGMDVSAPAAAITAMTINTSAFHSEIWRAGLQALPRDQTDAAKAAGLSRSGQLRLIVLPQVARAVLPALVNEITVLIKNSPAIAILGIVDVTRAAARIGADTFDPLPPFLAALGLYTAIVALIVAAQRICERRIGRRAG